MIILARSLSQDSFSAIMCGNSQPASAGAVRTDRGIGESYE
jgi:hypothetical protein